MGRLRILARGEAGASALEFAIVASALIVLAVGLVEFGRALHVRNELSFAADFAARAILTHPERSNDELEAEVRSALTSSEAERLEISVETETVDGASFRTVALSYPFTLLIPTLRSEPISMSIERRVPII